MSRQIVVITGKACSGKSELADRLKKNFGFSIIRTRQTNSEIDEIEVERRSGLNTAEQPDESKSLSIISRIQNQIESELKEISVVIDYLSDYKQVMEFRKIYREKLIHVHLYASTQTLHERYNKTQGSINSSLPYDDIDYLKDEIIINSLRKDADVRINTERSDSDDTLVRVAARLHLFTPPEIRCVDVLIGGQYGSEGKGNVVSFLAREYDVIVRVGGPNAGHTVASINGPYTYHHLPSGSRDVNARLLLGPGMTIHLEGLLKEIRECEIGPDRLFIDPQATIIEHEDKKTENDGHLVSTIASTGSGSGAAVTRRILERGKSTIRLARDVNELAPFVGSPRNYHGCTIDRLEDAYRNGQSVLLEGTQGSGLSLYHGTYPYVTSRDTNVAGCLAEAGISPSRVRKILMVIRPMPIRVGNPDGSSKHTSGPLKHETTFDEIARWAKLDPEELHGAEKTSTTHRKRRVGWFEWDQFRKACALNAPTDIVLTFADYLCSTNREARRFEQLDSETIKFIEELERVSQAPVSLINTRFARENDGTNDLRSVIDRRNWTGRSRTGKRNES